MPKLHRRRPSPDGSDRLRRRRLGRLLELARAYHGLTRKDLATAIGREPTSTLVPPSGIPKLDVAVDLARILDWPLEEVAGYLCPSPPAPTPEVGSDGGADFELLQQASRLAQHEGRFAQALAIARQAQQAARTPEERALAAVRAATSHEGLGQYRLCIEALRHGLAQQPISEGLRRMLESNLANGYCALGMLPEARSLAASLLAEFLQKPPRGKRDRTTQGFAHYTRGSVWRRSIEADRARATGHARRAVADLERAAALLDRVAADYDDPAYGGVANTCRGGVIEAQVVLRRKKPSDALDELWAPVACVLQRQPPLQGDWLESYGWWCIFACNIARRHFSDERQRQAVLERFLRVAREIVRRRQSWALREGILQVHSESHRRLREWTGRSLPLVLELDELRSLIGVMGRFPSFRQTGWQLVDEAAVLGRSTSALSSY